MRALFAFWLAIAVASPAAATAMQGSAGFLAGQPATSTYSVDSNICIPKSGGGDWCQAGIPTSFIVPGGSHAAAVAMDHGGSGSNVTFCGNNGQCSQKLATTAITGATWTSTGGGTTTFQVGGRFTGYVANDGVTLHVTAQTSGAESVGNPVTCPGGSSSMVIAAKKATAGGDVSTWTINSSTPTSSGACTAGDLSSILIAGQPFAVASVTCTGSGSCFNSPSGTGNGWTVIRNGVTATTIAVAQQQFVSPGTYSSGGVGSVYVMDATSVNASLATIYHTIFAYPQGPAPIGGTDAYNTGVFHGNIDSGGLQVTSTSSGVISAGMSPALACTANCTGFQSGTVITGFGTGQGFTGSYSVSIAQNVGSAGSPASFTSNGCLYAPNTTTWSNGVTTTCIDTTQYHIDLVSYLHSHYGVPNSFIFFFGHSNGGFNGQWLMRQQPGLFTAYGLLAGPASIEFNQYPVSPGTVAAVFAIIGDGDLVLDTNCALNASCSGTPNTFIGYLSTGSPGKLHVTSRTSGTQTVGAVVNCPGSQDGTYISGTLSTDPGDIATYSTTISQSTAAGGSCNSGNMFDPIWYQATTNASYADLVVPLHASEIGLMKSMADWANLYCAAGEGATLNPASAVTTTVAHGVQRTFSDCGDFIHVQELSNAGHPISTMTQAMGQRPLNQYMAWIKSHYFAGDLLYLYAANDPVFVSLEEAA